MIKKQLKRSIDRYVPVFLKKVQKFPYLPKQLIFTLDIVFAALCFFISFYLRYVFLDDSDAFDIFHFKLFVYLTITGCFFYLFNTYSEYVRYSSFRNIFRIFLSLFCSHALVMLLFSSFPVFFHYSPYGRVASITSFFMSAYLILLFRVVVRTFYDYVVRTLVKGKGIPLLIYGIDAVHIGIASMIRLDEKFPYYVAGFIARKPLPDSHQILGSRIYSMEDVFNKELIHSKGIKAILVRSEELQSEKRKALFRRFIENKIEILSMPTIENLKDIKKIRKINIEDLLGRKPIKTDIASIGMNLKGKTVMVTGAAGSIGSEIVRQLCRFDLKQLLLIDSAESPLHQLSLELRETTLIPHVSFIGDIRNAKRMDRIFEQFKPNYIYHAAAYKHVPMMELFPCEAVLTNVIGTKTVADLAVAHGAECFVMVSTDKAVNPTNVMGASKRIAEIYIQSMSTTLKNKQNLAVPQLRFITTRFGNVLGSSGSVIPRFAKQIAEGGPITVTHPDITRYFMTIPEACSLVLEAGNLGKGGEVFIFDMGETVKIKDLAEEMIRLSGLEPYKDIDIVYSGLRPGEKLYEELLHSKEEMKTMQNKKLMIGHVREYDFKQVSVWMDKLIETAETYSKEDIVKVMKEIVPEFISQNSEFETLDK